MSRWEGRWRTGLTVAVYAVVFLALLPGLLWATGVRLDRLTAALPVRPAGRLVGTLLIAAGAAGLAATVAALAARGRGWPISHLSPRRLVVRGPYRLVRHPLYFFFLCLFLGLGLRSGSWGVVLGGTGLLAAGSSIYALGFEEPRLRDRFGTDWEAYRRSVPGLLPSGRLGSALGRFLSSAWRRVVPLVERWADRTVLARTGRGVWVTYGAFTAAGAAVMTAWLAGLLGPAGLASGTLTLCLAGLAAAALVGARLAWLACRVPVLVRAPGRVLRRVGFVSWGSLAGLVGFGWAFAARSGLPPLWMLDRVLLATLPCMALGRLGCVTYGCCYGRPWSGGIRWRGPDSKVVRERGRRGAVPRVPTQLLEAAGAAAILVPAVWLTFTSVPSGAVAGTIVLLYGLVRFGSDCLRDEARFTRWRLTAGQLAGGASIVLAWAALFVVDGAPGWSAPAVAVAGEDLLRGLPGVGAAALLVFLVCGFHWRRVGRW